MIPTLKYRIYFVFVPHEWQTPHFVHTLSDDKDTILKAFEQVAKERYPTTYKDVETTFWEVNDRAFLEKSKYVGNKNGFNARYEVHPILQVEDRYFKLEELTQKSA